MAVTLTGRIALDGADAIRRAFADIGRAGEEGFRKIKSASSGINFDKGQQSAQALTKDLQALGEAGAKAGADIATGMDTVQASVAGASGGIRGVLEGFAGAALTAGVAIGGIATAASGALSAMAKSAATASAEIETNAKKLQLTTDAYQDLVIAAAQAGLAQKEAVSGFGAFTNSLNQARTALEAAGKKWDAFGDLVTRNVFGIAQLGPATEKAIGPLAALGAEVLDVNGNLKSQSEILDLVAERFKALGPGKEQDDLATKLGLKDLLPLLKDGKEAFHDLLEEAKQTGRALTPDQIGIGKAFDDAIDELKGSLVNLRSALSATAQQIGLVFVPGNTKTTEFFTEIIDSITRLVDANRPLLVGLATTANGFAELVKVRLSEWASSAGQAIKSTLLPALSSVVRVAEDLAGRAWKSVLLPALTAVDQGFNDLADTINRVFGTNISGRFVELATAAALLGGAFAAYQGWLTPVVDGLLKIGVAVAAHPVLFAAAAVAGVLLWDDIKAAAISAYEAIKQGGTDAYGSIKQAGADAYEVLLAGARAFRSGLENLVKGNWADAWQDFQDAGAQALEALEERFPKTAKVVEETGRALKSAFDEMRLVFTDIARAINSIFGTQLTGDMVALGAAVLVLSGRFDTLTLSILALVEAYRQVSAFFRSQIANQQISDDNLKQQIKSDQAAFEEFKSKFFQGDLGGAFGAIGKRAAEGLKDIFTSPRADLKAIQDELKAGADATGRAWEKMARDAREEFRALREEIKGVKEEAGVPLPPVRVDTTEAANSLRELKAAFPGVVTGEQDVSTVLPPVRPPEFGESIKSAEEFKRSVEDVGGAIQRLPPAIPNIGESFDAARSKAEGFREVVRADKEGVIDFGAAAQRLNDVLLGPGATGGTNPNLMTDAVDWAEVGALIADAKQRAVEAAPAIKELRQQIEAPLPPIRPPDIGQVEAAFQSLKLDEEALADTKVSLPAPDMSAWQGIVGEAQRIAGEVVAAFTQISDTVLVAFGGLSGAVEGTLSGISGVVDSMVASISASLDALMAKIQEVTNAAANAGSSSSGSDVSSDQGFAGGGLVLGAGTGTSDSILARLSHGEFVIRAAIVREFLPLLRAINEGRIRFADIVGRMPRFADGGLVDALAGSLSGFAPSSLVGTAPALAGASPGGPALHLHLSSGQVIETRVVRGESALSELHRESLRQQRLSLGRRPKHG